MAHKVKDHDWRLTLKSYGDSLLPVRQETPVYININFLRELYQSSHWQVFINVTNKSWLFQYWIIIQVHHILCFQVLQIEPSSLAPFSLWSAINRPELEARNAFELLLFSFCGKIIQNEEEKDSPCVRATGPWPKNVFSNWVDLYCSGICTSLVFLNYKLKLWETIKETMLPVTDEWD